MQQSPSLEPLVAGIIRQEEPTYFSEHFSDNYDKKYKQTLSTIVAWLSSMLQLKWLCDMLWIGSCVIVS